MLRQRAFIALLPVLALAVASCGGDDAGTTSTPDTSGVPTADTSAPDTSTDATSAPGTGVSPVAAGEPFPADRCQANKDAGTITFLTGFDYAAAASMVEVFVAQDKGYYEDLCLDVQVQPSFSTANYPLLAANDAQFASAGSFSEVVSYADANDADFVVVSSDGHVPIDVLMVKEGEATTLEDLKGTTIGVKGKLPPSIAAMLAGAGLREGTDFDTVLVDGFDPVAHMALPGIVGVPGWKSNEPGQLERAGVAFTSFDPAEDGVPGSFGLIYTNGEFASEHPTAVEDFMRATMQGLADAISDPAAAADVAVELINGNGNPNYLSPEGEVFRWQTEAGLVTSTTPQGSFPGVLDPASLQAEVDANAAVGLFGDTPPSLDGRFDADVVAGLYAEDGSIVWPAS